MSYFMMLAFFFTEYVRPSSYIPALNAFHFNSIVPLTALVASVKKSNDTLRQRLLAEPNTRIIGFFLALVAMSVVMADVQERALNAWEIVLGYSFIYWVIASEVNTMDRVKGVVKTLIGVHLIVAALNPVIFTDPGTRSYIASGSFLGDGNDFALSLDIILPLCLFLFLDTKKTMQKLLWASALLVCVAGVVASQSRGGTIGLGCMALYYWTKSRKKVQTALVAAVVILLIFVLAPGAYFDRMNMIGDTQEGSAQARIEAWKIAFQMALDNPIFGVGAAHFPIKIGTEYRPPGFVGSGMTAHSIYFLALGELGFPGIFMILAYITSNLHLNRKLAQEVRERNSPTAGVDIQVLASLSAALIAFASGGAFLSAIYYPHMFVLGGLLTATRHVVRERTLAADAPAALAQKSGGVTYHWALRRPRPAWNTRPEDQPDLTPQVNLRSGLNPRAR